MSAFKITHQDGKTRVGELQTAHGVIKTPNFFPVGTQGTVKALSPRDLNEIGVQAVLANTYHLMLRPGVDVIKKLGGLHKFMDWEKPVMTDSGGFQVFSLGVALEHGVGKLLRDQLDTPGVESQIGKPRLNKITEEGVEFQSHLDGSKHILSPEKSIKLQLKLGADLIVAFDDLESPRHSYNETLKSLELTERWALRSLKEFDKRHPELVSGSHEIPKQVRNDNDRPLLYGVTHGGIFNDLRIRSAKFMDQHFEAIALGGAHKDKKTLYQVIEWTVENISKQKPRHLLGIGEVEDLLECVERGIDLFDCASPSRRARNGSLYISPPAGRRKNNFTLYILNSKFKSDPKPIDPKCNCYTCQNFSKAYLRHLYLAKELLYHQLATYHNMYFITLLMRDIRESVKNESFKELKKKWFR